MSSDKTISALTNQKVLITGGAGYLAASVVGLLKDADCTIIRLDRESAYFTPVRGEARVEDVRHDLRDPDIWPRVLAGVDIVYHFAAQTSVYAAEDAPAQDQRVNVLPMLHLLEACRKNAWTPKVVFAGTVTEAGLTASVPVDESHPDVPITVYDNHKLMAELYLKQYARDGKVRGVVLRLANLYGPGPRSSSADRGIMNLMIRRALDGKELTIYGDGRHVRDYVHVDDVAAAFLLAAAHAGRLSGNHYVIGSGTGHTLADAIHLVAARVERKTGRRVAVTHVPPPARFSPIENRDFVANTTKFASATGWRANVSLEQGIDRTIDAFLTEAQQGS
jgi:nucleoside-diphosphate-sugar epimerase